MASLQKFKLFASHCGAVQSPTRSPRTSPMVQLPRPKTTLRALLGLSLTRPPRQREHVSASLASGKEKDPLLRRHKLKDLFVSSPPREEEEEDARSTTAPLLGSVAAVGIGGNNDMGLARSGSWRAGPGSMNPGWVGFRCRSLLKRKAWRPLLHTITE